MHRTNKDGFDLFPILVLAACHWVGCPYSRSMCGILAVANYQGNDLGSRLEHAVKTMIHRGPDCQSFWLDPSRRVGLGHARLSIIDLTSGDQPIANEDGTLHIVANGEFYDHDAIMAELEERGHRFRTRSDSEIALHLYEEYGTSCLEKLRGEFAFVIWDSTNETLFVARDRFGIKPLYYSVQEGTLYIASEMKALFAAGVAARWNPGAVHQWSSCCVSMQAHTLFHNVQQLPAGHYLLSTKKSLRTFCYWDFDYPIAEQLGQPRALEECIEGFREVFDEAVRLRLRADVPLGCYLSGGLDSCAVLGTMAQHCSTPVRAFTLTFDQADYDESDVAAEMAELAGADYFPISIRQSDIAENFENAIWHSETFFGNGHGVSKFLLSRAVNEAGYKVVFTGEGSDEILAGYPHFRQDMLLHSAVGQNPGEVEELLKELREGNSVSKGLLMPDGTAGSMATAERILGFVPTWIQANASIAAKLNHLLAPEFREDYRGRDGYRQFFNELDVPRQLLGRDPLNQSLYLWSKSSLPDYILNVLGDRMEMAHSIEGRVPFLDHRVVEFMRNIPVNYKISGMTEKFLLKEAAKPLITDTVYRRQKHPFLSPPATMASDEPLFALIQDKLRGETMANQSFFDQKSIVETLDRLDEMPPEERMGFDPTFMALTSLCIMQERFGLSL